MTGANKLALILAVAAGTVLLATESNVLRVTQLMEVERQANHAHSEKSGQPAAYAPYMDCQRLLKDGSWLRWQVAQRPDRGEWRIDCSYGDRGEVRL